MSRRQWRYGLLIGLSVIAVILGLQLMGPRLTPQSSSQPSASLLVAAAASLQNPLQAIAALDSPDLANVSIRYTFAASGVLQRQIEQGAPIDILIAAAEKQMQALQEQGLILTDTRSNLLTNQLVLVVPKTALPSVARFQDLVQPQIKRLAIGEPRSVPAGHYALEVLENLGILEQVRPKFVLSNNVKAVLTAVETGNVDAGIVYWTDAQASSKVAVVSVADRSLHSPIVYPIAIVRSSRSLPQAEQYLEFLKREPAQAIFQRYGFGRPAA
ncbi:molybdate ABC transporter substrate-binding protein [Synechococcus elongatus]|uniref:molybdate ABC transporter substrate-binding protein n=1 Tax=Synechococcus elongatus TaxID=32046 RepID=UPI0030D156D9